MKTSTFALVCTLSLLHLSMTTSAAHLTARAAPLDESSLHFVRVAKRLPTKIDRACEIATEILATLPTIAGARSELQQGDRHDVYTFTTIMPSRPKITLIEPMSGNCLRIGGKYAADDSDDGIRQLLKKTIYDANLLSENDDGTVVTRPIFEVFHQMKTKYLTTDDYRVDYEVDLNNFYLIKIQEFSNGLATNKQIYFARGNHDNITLSCSSLSRSNTEAKFIRDGFGVFFKVDADNQHLKIGDFAQFKETEFKPRLINCMKESFEAEASATSTRLEAELSEWVTTTNDDDETQKTGWFSWLTW